MIPDKFKNYMFNEHDYFPEDYKVESPSKEKKIKKLVSILSDDINFMFQPHNVTNSDPDMWLFDKLLTEEEIDFCLSFKKKRSVKLTAAELAKRNKMTESQAREIAERICRKCILDYDRENTKKEKQYFLPAYVVGFGEYLVMNGELMEQYPEIATFFNYALTVPTGKSIHMLAPGGSGFGMHVIPVEKAIEAEPQAVPIEKLSRWLKMYDKYCLDVCACRRSQRVRGEGGPDIEDYWCIGLGDFAEYLVETGKDARYATYEEVMEVLEKAEKAGYVHQITNMDGEDKIVGICNCASTTCQGFKNLLLYNAQNFATSAYRAHVDQNKCVACGKCVEVCPAGAAKLGQKLCRKNGRAVEYPKAELARNKHIHATD